MEINDANHIKLNTVPALLSEILNLYEKIPTLAESQQMMDSFLEKFDLSNENKIVIKQHLENLNLNGFNKEGIILFIQNKIENQFNVDPNHAEKIVSFGLEFARNYVLIAQKQRETEILKLQNERKEIEFNKYLSELNLEINREIEIKKKKIDKLKTLVESNLQIDDFIECTYKVLDKSKDESFTTKQNNQIDDFLNNNLDEIIEL
ncbi:MULTISPECIES: hypothetical protein [Flavobacterium]|uniref:hypothetical protein n=1 Tax=Flavobacterium TaxID=237 RepID=UPI001183B84F|nr:MULTISPECIES: hypothetical protein [Flavobacterium]MCR4031352.1 hypothetical protein [Flavobacterium panacis]